MRLGTVSGWDQRRGRPLTPALLARYRTALDARWAAWTCHPLGSLVHHAAGLGGVQPGSDAVLRVLGRQRAAGRGATGHGPPRSWPGLAGPVWLDGTEVVTGW